MSPHRERLFRGRVVSEHLIHLFDEPRSLVDTVSTYLFDAWQRGDAFTLLCGYSSPHFGDERTTRHLDRLCGAHTDSGAVSTDLLASWLLAERRSKFHIPNR